MAVAEDAASVLDEFVHDVANLPNEIQHLLEEVQAKDEIIQQSRLQVDRIDNSLQKHVKQNGGHVRHPKDDQWAKLVQQHYDKMQVLQDDKVALSQKACILLDRHVKRLDLKIRTLQTEGSLGALLDDPSLPSTIHPSAANLVEPTSARGSGISTPLNSFPYPLQSSNQGGGAPNIANAAMARMANTAAQANRGLPAAPIAGMAPHALMGTSSQRAGREGSADASKRKKLHLGPLPSSNLARSASAGPGTPKAGTPVSRAGSLGPRTKKATMKKAGAPEHPLRKKVGKSGISKKAARRLKSGHRASPSTTGEDGSDASGSEEDDVSQSQAEGADEDAEMADGGYEEEESDQTPYCVCRNPSHGDMIGCDNKKCKYEWFHYECVGLKFEPKGKWLCPTCRNLPPTQVRYEKGTSGK